MGFLLSTCKEIKNRFSSYYSNFIFFNPVRNGNLKIYIKITIKKHKTGAAMPSEAKT
jgi:hypothetical protein